MARKRESLPSRAISSWQFSRTAVGGTEISSKNQGGGDCFWVDLFLILIQLLPAPEKNLNAI